MFFISFESGPLSPVFADYNGGININDEPGGTLTFRSGRHDKMLNIHARGGVRRT